MFKNTPKILQKYSTLLYSYSTPGENPENTLLYSSTFRKYSTLLEYFSKSTPPNSDPGVKW